MALADFRAKWLEDKKKHHYNPLLHGETVTYIPYGTDGGYGAGFDQGFAIIDSTCREINVHIVDVGSLEMDGLDTETKVERIEVKAIKDECTGINRPNLGDRIVRQTPWDEDGRPYFFTGDDVNQGPHDWRLTFERQRRWTQGVTP
jgi:hypothetical protein